MSAWVPGALDEAGGLADLVAAHEQVSAYHGNNYLPFMEKFYRRNCSRGGRWQAARDRRSSSTMLMR